MFWFKLDQNLKLGKVKDIQAGIMQKVEILFALQKLGEKLKPEEDEFLVANMHNSMKQFEVASTNIGLFSIFFFKELNFPVCFDLFLMTV
jgi:hypothetical protein